MAEALLAKCDTQEALLSSQRALELAEEVGDMRGEALSLQCMAKAVEYIDSDVSLCARPFAKAMPSRRPLRL